GVAVLQEHAGCPDLCRLHQCHPDAGEDGDGFARRGAAACVSLREDAGRFCPSLPLKPLINYAETINLIEWGVSAQTFSDVRSRPRKFEQEENCGELSRLLVFR